MLYSNTKNPCPSITQSDSMFSFAESLCGMISCLLPQDPPLLVPPRFLRLSLWLTGGFTVLTAAWVQTLALYSPQRSASPCTCSGLTCEINNPRLISRSSRSDLRGTRLVENASSHFPPLQRRAAASRPRQKTSVKWILRRWGGLLLMRAREERGGLIEERRGERREQDWAKVRSDSVLCQFR